MQLFHAQVMHKRYRPKVNAFTYPVLYALTPISSCSASLRNEPDAYGELKAVGESWKKLGGLISFYPKDHGARDGSSLREWIEKVLVTHGIDASELTVTVLAHPRQLGYVFNPVSFWFCEDGAGQLRAVLAEVNNTFGEHHSYLVAHTDGRPIESDDWLEAQKAFHVSPFLPVEGTYRFRFSRKNNRLGIWIEYSDAQGKMLDTALTGTLTPFANTLLLKHFMRHPLMTFGVIARIHWQAVKLWYKGARFHSKPPPPNNEFTRT